MRDRRVGRCALEHVQVLLRSIDPYHSESDLVVKHEMSYNPEPASDSEYVVEFELVLEVAPELGIVLGRMPIVALGLEPEYCYWERFGSYLLLG